MENSNDVLLSVESDVVEWAWAWHIERTLRPILINHGYDMLAVIQDMNKRT